MKKRPGDKNGSEEEEKNKDGVREEDEAGKEAWSSKKAKRPNGDESASRSGPSVVLCLSRALMTSRRDSSCWRRREKAVDDGKRRKSGDVAHEFDKIPNVVKAGEKDLKSCCLPLNRVRNIARSDDPNVRVTQEAYFLICKATECFIEQFCEDAFSLASSHGLKKLLKYDHLASVVYNMDRYDYLSDYVPRKMKAKDALADSKAAEAGQL